MTIVCRQHLPAYFDHSIERETWSFKDAAEMLASDHFACWRDDPRFHRFSISDNHFMVEQNGGSDWWVIGYLKADDASELASIPIWREPNVAG